MGIYKNRGLFFLSAIGLTGSMDILFADSNFAGSLPPTMELMEALIPLRIRWSALWSAHLCKNDAFMDLARKSGLLHLNIGMESIDSNTLISMNKKAYKVSEYKLILEGLRRRGISYSLNYPSMFKRLPLPVTMRNIASWVINFSQRKVAQAGGMETFDDF